MLAALNEPEFRRLYFARGFSQLGDGLVPVALAFAVLDVDLRRPPAWSSPWQIQGSRLPSTASRS
jgi:hypothetical protein